MVSMLCDKLVQTTAGTSLIVAGIVYYAWMQRRGRVGDRGLRIED
jgi:hypothetical protein